MFRVRHSALPTLALLGLAVLTGLPAALGAVARFDRALAQEAAQGGDQGAAAPSRSRRVRVARARRATEKPEKSEKPDAAALPPGMQQAIPVVTYGDWNVFTNGQGKARVCYAIAQPQSRTPKSLPRDTGYLFVTIRKGENVQNEIAVMFGFKPKVPASQTKPGTPAAKTDPYLTLGATRFGLVVKDENAWVQNQAEEARIVTEMGKSQTATVRATSARGNATSDDYALGGFSEALKRARDECNK